MDLLWIGLGAVTVALVIACAMPFFDNDNWHLDYPFRSPPKDDK